MRFDRRRLGTRFPQDLLPSLECIPQHLKAAALHIGGEYEIDDVMIWAE